MEYSVTPLNGLFVVTTTPNKDNRGEFYRLYCSQELQEIQQTGKIVQINFSRTLKKGAIRGIHFQNPPVSEAKWVRCLKGSVFDIAVDLRRNSPTFLQWYGEVLSKKNMKMLFIPEGFAHGFQALEDDCEMLYLHTEFYNPAHESGIRFDDPLVGIQWPFDPADISKKDLNHPLLDSNFKGIVI